MSHKKLGFWTSSSLVVGNMIGSGVILLPATLASFGSISLFGWILSAIGAMALSFVFIEISKVLPATSGGPYTYTRKGLGDFAGFLVAWGYWISIWCTNAAIALAFIGYLSFFIPILGENNLVALVSGLAVVWIIAWINNRGVRAAGIFQLVTTIMKITPLIVIGIGGLFFMEMQHFESFNISGTSNFEAITSAATLTFFAYMGLECATVPAADVHEPEKTIPRATRFGLIVTALVYIICSVSIMGMIPAEELRYSNAPFADAATMMWGKNAGYLVAFGALVSTLGALNGWILIQGQIPAAIARDRLFPSIFGKINKHGAPASSLIISCLLLSILMVMNHTEGLVGAFKFTLLLGSMTALLAYLFTSASYLVIFSTRMHTIIPGKGTLIAILGFFFSLWAIAGSGQEIVYWGFVLIMLGIPVYAWIRARNKWE